jgi:hypothetical protein
VAWYDAVARVLIATAVGYWEISPAAAGVAADAVTETPPLTVSTRSRAPPFSLPS